MKTVVIDPGHGGQHNTGGSSPNNAIGPQGTLEKTLTLALGQRVHVLVSQSGVKAVLTRSKDVNLGLAERAKVARDIEADAYVSIHFNGLDGKVQGTETYVHSRGNDRSHNLAKLVQYHVVGATGLADRGVKRSSFVTLSPDHHHPNTAACLLEVSFLDVAEEEKRLMDSAYLDRLASAITEAMRTYLTMPSPMSDGGSEAEREEPQDGYETWAR